MTQRMPMISTIVDDSHVISTSVGTYCFQHKHGDNVRDDGRIRYHELCQHEP